MANIGIKTDGFARVAHDFGFKMPAAVLVEVQEQLRSDMGSARVQLLSNLSGGVLNRKTGKLAESVTAKVRADRTGVSAKAGSRYYVGRFWEDGFTRGGKLRGPKKWAQPVMDAMKAKIERDIESAIERGLKRESK